MTPPKLSAVPQARLDCYLVFSSSGSLCRAHVGDEAEFTAASHASVINGFTVKVPIVDDYREH